MAAMELLRCGKDLEGHGEVDKAEEMYRLALAADPEHAGWPLSQDGAEFYFSGRDAADVSPLALSAPDVGRSSGCAAASCFSLSILRPE